jgi:hypothetical protein
MHAQPSGLRIPKFPLFTIAVLLLTAGCAKIADVRPPLVRIPKPATDLAARQVSDFVMLSVSMPAQNTDGSPVSTLRKANIYRFSQDKRPAAGRPLSDTEFLKQAVLIESIPSTSFAGYLNNGAFRIQDRLQLPSGDSIDSHEFEYAALFVNNKNQAAGLSNRVRIELIPIPPPPDSLSATVTEHSIQLKWDAPIQNMDGSEPARIAGYEIFRSEARDSFPTTPVNATPLEKAEFEDRNFEFDKTYYYEVRTIGSFQNPRAESLPSKAFEVAARDTFAPSPPGDFKALLEGGTVILLWTPSRSNDVAGYRIYRQETGTKTRRLVQNDLVSSWSFRDHQVTPGKSYEYGVTAVDFHGNESETALATVEIP